MRFVCVVLLSCALVVCGVKVTGGFSQSPSCWNTISPFPGPIAACYGQGMCHCSNITADCSSNSNSLTFIPDLHRSYRYLNFSNNNVTSISDATFFSNVSRDVEVIDLHSNGLTHIARGVFDGLRKLTGLYLGGSNHLVYKSVPSLLSVPGLHNLSLRCLGLGPFPSDPFQEVKHSQVLGLDLSWNHLGSLNMSVLQPLRHLSYVTVWHNEIYDLSTAEIPSLDNLNMEDNRLFNFPKTCSEQGKSLFPNLTVLSLDQNMIQSIDNPVCLPSLRILALRYNHFQYFDSNTFSSQRFPVLQDLEIMQMENKIFRMSSAFINNSAVRSINLLWNNVDFAQSYVNADAFLGCTSVQFLNLGENVFQGVSDDKFHRLLEPMEKSLNVISLSRTQLSQISPTTFSRLRNLTGLYMYGNSLSAIPDGALDQIHQLQRLVLDHNHIQTISEATFDAKLREGLHEVILGDNPFQCDCDLLWFQNWMRTRPTIFKNYHTSGYRCANLDNVPVEHFVLNPQACMLSPSVAILIISISCLIIIAFVLAIVLFRCRWQMRLCLYEVCRGRRRRSRLPRGCKYDVFVSYAVEDSAWVQEELLPVLEEQWGLRLCVHHRDFRPGKHIVDNISDCVSDSERVLLVFSPDFARSEWCQFELKYCQSCVMERDDVMVLVALRETLSRDMTGAMLAVLRTTTYIEWGEERDARQSFWPRLRLALEDTEDLPLV